MLEKLNIFLGMNNLNDQEFEFLPPFLSELHNLEILNLVLWDNEI